MKKNNQAGDDINKIQLFVEDNFPNNTTINFFDDHEMSLINVETTAGVKFFIILDTSTFKTFKVDIKDFANEFTARDMFESYNEFYPELSSEIIFQDFKDFEEKLPKIVGELEE